MEDELVVRVEAPAEIMLLRPLNQFVHHLLGQIPYLSGNDELLNNLELVFDEAFTYIHRHAYRSEEKGPVAIDIKIGSDRLEFRFEDRGEGFDPEGVRAPDLDEPKEGGLGVWLIRQVMDEFIYYCTLDRRNVLRLVKRFSESGPCGPEDRGP